MNKILITEGCGFIDLLLKNFKKKKFIVTVADLWKSPEIIDFEKKFKNLIFKKINIF